MSTPSALDETLEFVEMHADLSTREAAQAWLTRRIRKLGLILIVGVVLSPVASALVVGGRFFLRKRELPPISALVSSSLAWSVVAIALLLVVAGLIALKYLKFARRVGPLLRDGIESDGRVVDVQCSQRKSKSGVIHGKVTLTVVANDLTWIASLEESQGTKLPKVHVGAPAKVWTLGPRAVIATSGSLFETT